MEIKKFKKIKNNEYEIYLENNLTIKLYEDTIIKYNLLSNNNITQKDLDIIVKDNNKLKAYHDSLKYLKTKLRTELEINKHLKNKSYSKEDITKTVNLLKKQGYINDELVMNSYINDQYNLTNNGPYKIKTNLIKLGIPEEKIIIEKDFDSKIKKLIEKKIKSNTKFNTNKLKLNIYNYFINLGYPKEMFMPYLDNIAIDDNKLIKKDYEILYNKYKNKYKGKELNYFLKNKLYQKGYNLDIIKLIIEED